MRAGPQITYELRAMAQQDYSPQLTRLLRSAADEIDALHEIERMQEWRPIIGFEPNATNSGAATLNVDALGAKSIVMFIGPGIGE